MCLPVVPGGQSGQRRRVCKRLGDCCSAGIGPVFRLKFWHTPGLSTMNDMIDAPNGFESNAACEWPIDAAQGKS